ncbi:hypothetical protein D3C86_1287020 [compost metagenome]
MNVAAAPVPMVSAKAQATPTRYPTNGPNALCAYTNTPPALGNAVDSSATHKARPPQSRAINNVAISMFSQPPAASPKFQPENCPATTNAIPRPAIFGQPSALFLSTEISRDPKADFLF